MSQNAAIAMIEARARQLWDERENCFPKFTRMTWEAGTRQAKHSISIAAFDQLIAEGLIETRATGIYPGPNAVSDLQSKTEERSVVPG